MTEFVVLTLEQVDALFPVDPKTGSREKITSPGHALCPIPLDGDREFILPIAVIADEKHAAAFEALKTDRDKPVDLKAAQARREVAEAEFKRAVEVRS